MQELPNPGADFENRVRGAFKRIGFRVEGGPAMRVGGHQIDCCAAWDDVLIVVECTQSTADRATLRNRISEVRGKQGAIKAGFRRLPEYRTFTRFVFAIATNISPNESDLQLAAQKQRIHILDDKFLQYYENLAAIVDRSALFNLLGDLEVEPRDLEFPRVPAFQFTFAKYGPAYLFWCDPYELLKIAYVARRGAGRENYYQRLLTAERLRSIRKYIDDEGVFPNDIIVAFADKKPGFREMPGYREGWPTWLKFGELQFPKSYRSASVIDGQHRLYAFGLKDPNPKGQKLAVMAFERLAESAQAKFFIDINHEQKPVARDLILDLQGDLRPETDSGRIANSVKELNKLEPLKNAIYLPLTGESSWGKLKISGLFDDLSATGLLNPRTHNMTQGQRNPLVSGVAHNRVAVKVATAISSFLKSVKDRAPETMWRTIFLKPGGMTLAVTVYERILVRLGRTPSDADLSRFTEAFVSALHHIAPDEASLKSLNRQGLTSYAQRRLTANEVLVRMREELNDKVFAQHGLDTDPLLDRLIAFERVLARYVTGKLNLLTVVDLKRSAPADVHRRASTIFEKESKTNAKFSIDEALSLGDIKQIVERNDNWINIKDAFVADDAFGTKEEVIAALAHLGRARNAPAHGRRGGNKTLVEAYLATFQVLIGSQ
jgi:DGQHR domain-containing protein